MIINGAKFLFDMIIESITRVIDGGEPAEFKTLFKRWKDVGEVTSLKKMS